jgi:large subunit ribosomal protein L5
MARLQEYYRGTIVPRLREDLGIQNAMQVPKITKITVNMGVGEAVADRKVMDAAVTDLTKITGQKPQVTKARKAIASFKLRAGLPVGAKVTLRGSRMYEFLDRLINIAMPRIRDFRGVSPRSFDGQGNYSLGVKEQIIFPEIQYDQVDQIRGMDITITTTAVDNRQGRALLEAFNFPFRKQEEFSSGEDEHGRARAASRQDRKEIRGTASPTEGNHPQSADFPGRARGRAGETAIASARCEPFAAAQPLRDYGPLPRCVPQVRSLAGEDSRGRLPGRDSGSVEGELVRGAL